MTLDFEAKLRSRMVETPSGCWEWTGARTTAGYGEFRQRGEHHYTHRTSWIVHNGPIPDGLHVLHRCDNPPCFRPDHLFLGDNQANTDDKIAKGRMRHGHLHGDDHPNAVLTWQKVRQIRARRANGETYPALVKAFGVSLYTIWEILNNRRWKE